MGNKTAVDAYLLDTHIFLWAVRWADIDRLSDGVRDVIEEPGNTLYVSSISVYEIVYKYRLGKIPEYANVAEDISAAINGLGAVELPVTIEHAERAGAFDWGHRDPFDIILSAQAMTKNLTLITSDQALLDCPFINTLW